MLVAGDSFSFVLFCYVHLDAIYCTHRFEQFNCGSQVFALWRTSTISTEERQLAAEGTSCFPQRFQVQEPLAVLAGSHHDPVSDLKASRSWKRRILEKSFALRRPFPTLKTLASMCHVSPVSQLFVTVIGGRCGSGKMKRVAPSWDSQHRFDPMIHVLFVSLHVIKF